LLFTLLNLFLIKWIFYLEPTLLNIFSQCNQTWAFHCCTRLATINFFFLLTLFYIVLCWGSNDTIDKGDEICCIASTLYSLTSLLICIVILEMKKKTLGSFGECSLQVLSSFPFLFKLSKSLRSMWETNSFLQEVWGRPTPFFIEKQGKHHKWELWLLCDMFGPIGLGVFWVPFGW
jgi:hypothetical protein